MKTNILTLAITLTVGIILAGSLLMPVISEATETEKTFNNEGYYYMTDLGEDSITYVFDGSKWTINDVVVDIDITDLTTIVAAENVIIRANGYFRGTTTINASALNLTVTADSITGTATVSGNTQTINLSLDVYYCAVTEPTGYVLSKYNTPTYLHKDSDILADGQSAYTPSASAVFRIEGNINDGFTVTPALASITVTDVKCNYTVIDEYIDLYRVDSITFKSVYNSGTPSDPSDDVVRDQTYSSYVVPASVTSEMTNHLNSGEIAILNALPVLIIAALVLMAAGAIILKRED